MNTSESYLFGALLGMAAVAGLTASKLHQPVIVAFVAIGPLSDQWGTGWVVANDHAALLSRPMPLLLVV